MSETKQNKTKVESKESDCRILIREAIGRMMAKVMTACLLSGCVVVLLCNVK